MGLGGAAFLLAASLVWGSVAGVYAQTRLGPLLLVLIQAALLNAALSAALLWLWNRTTAAQAEQRRMQRDLRHLARWASEEGILRKTGLIRDLNAVGLAPRDLADAALQGADLGGTDLRGCRLTGADLRKANLQGARLDGADLQGARLGEANLTRASLRGANLRGCELESAQLVRADLGGATLQRANLVSANLEGAELGGAHLDRARFALQEGSLLQRQAHPSVEDWIRERLDGRGVYRAGGPEEPHPSAPEPRARVPGA